MHTDGTVVYLCTQDGAPSAEQHQADDTSAHDHRHQENHHHTQLSGEMQGWRTYNSWGILRK